MLNRTSLEIYRETITSAIDCGDYRDEMVKVLYNKIDLYNLSKSQLIELYDQFQDYDQVSSFLMIHEFKNPELKNVLKIHRGINYINNFINNPQRFLSNIKKIINDLNLPNKFFTNYPNQSFDNVLKIEEEFIINYLLNSSNEFKEPDLIAQLFCLTIYQNQFNQFSNVSEPTLLNAAKKLLIYPQKTQLLAKHLSFLGSIEFIDGGQSTDNYRKWTRELISRLPIPNKPNHQLVNQLEEYFKENPIRLENFSLSDTWKFLRLQGRTILMQNKENEILAIKVKKTDEPVDELQKEYLTTRFLKNHANELNLKSYFPCGIGIYQIADVKQLLEKSNAPENLSLTDFTALIGMTTNQFAYIYKVEAGYSDYFTYIHDIALDHDTYCAANRTMINDLLQLLANGLVYHQLADIFHNTEKGHQGRDDQGRYLILVDLLRWGTNTGTGRLTAWKKATEFLNVRGKGGADWGDWMTLLAFLSQHYFSGAQGVHKEKLSNFVIPNIIAEYLYVLFLAAGSRGYNLTQQAKKSNLTKQAIEETVKKIWQKLAEQVFDNCVIAMTYFTPFTNADAKTFLETTVNVDLIAKQMQFWMTEDYIEPFQKNEIPKGIYDESVSLRADFSRVRKSTFNTQVGCSINEVDQDLGVVNGQEPIKEFNKALYWTVSAIVCWYHVFSKANREIDNMVMQADLVNQLKSLMANQDYVLEDSWKQDIRKIAIKFTALMEKDLSSIDITSLSKQQLKVLIAYRESLIQQGKIFSAGEQTTLQHLKEQYAARVIQESCHKKIKEIKKAREDAAKAIQKNCPQSLQTQEGLGNNNKPINQPFSNSSSLLFAGSNNNRIEQTSTPSPDVNSVMKRIEN